MLRSRRCHPAAASRVDTQEGGHARRATAHAILDERFAAGWLEARGYRIVERNWRCPAGELDFVAERGGELVFVAVKTRHGERMGAPEEAVTRTKRLRLVAAVQEYLVAHGTLERPQRIDVVAVALAPSGRLLVVRHYPRSIGIEE
jgi:putative endonuclease